MLICEKKLLGDQCVLKASYHLLEKEIKVNDLNAKIYGIEIDTENLKSGKCESVSYGNISFDRTEVLQMLNTFADGAVTSIHLQYVLEDML